MRHYVRERLHCRCGRNACASDRVAHEAGAAIATLEMKMEKGNPGPTGDPQLQVVRPLGAHASSDRVKDLSVNHIRGKAIYQKTIGHECVISSFFVRP